MQFDDTPTLEKEERKGKKAGEKGRLSRFKTVHSACLLCLYMYIYFFGMGHIGPLHDNNALLLLIYKHRKHNTKVKSSNQLDFSKANECTLYAYIDTCILILLQAQTCYILCTPVILFTESISRH